MIGRLHGRLLYKQPPALVLDVQGVGYELEAPMSTFYKLPEIGAEVQLYTHLVVREDAHLLFGFADDLERRMFRFLLKVTGIGAKTSLAILSGMDADGLARCIQAGDIERLIRLPGIGRKTAERLVVEMRDRLRDWSGTATGRAPGGAESARASSPVDEATSALIALGYKPQEASRLVHAVEQEGLGSEALIREALRASIR